jgi:hypothetical protein
LKIIIKCYKPAVITDTYSVNTIFIIRINSVASGQFKPILFFIIFGKTITEACILFIAVFVILFSSILFLYDKYPPNTHPVISPVLIKHHSPYIPSILLSVPFVMTFTSWLFFNKNILLLSTFGSSLTLKPSGELSLFQN